MPAGELINLSHDELARLQAIMYSHSVLVAKDDMESITQMSQYEASIRMLCYIPQAIRQRQATLSKKSFSMANKREGDKLDSLYHKVQELKLGLSTEFCSLKKVETKNEIDVVISGYLGFDKDIKKRQKSNPEVVVDYWAICDQRIEALETNRKSTEEERQLMRVELLVGTTALAGPRPLEEQAPLKEAEVNV